MLIGKRIYIKPFEPTEWGSLSEWYFSSDYKEFFRDVSIAPNQFGFQAYANIPNGYTFLVRNNNDQVVGCVVVYGINWRPMSGRIGVLIDKDFQGYGYSMEAVCLIGEYCIEHLRLRKVICEVVEGNEKLAHIVGLGGFKKEARLLDEAFIDGKYFNVDRYCIFADEAKVSIENFKKETR